MHTDIFFFPSETNSRVRVHSSGDVGTTLKHVDHDFKY